jgi:hypothetical protein
MVEFLKSFFVVDKLLDHSKEVDFLLKQCMYIRLCLMQIYEAGYCLNNRPEVINQNTDVDIQ